MWENLTSHIHCVLINLANERLQKLFNDVTFKQELAIYAEEGIEMSKSDFPDNQVGNSPCRYLCLHVGNVSPSLRARHASIS